MEENKILEEWFDDYAENEDALQVQDYDITASPNDFTVEALFSFLKSGMVRIPSFQRSFVWDRKRASKLIESIILGLPIPQIFIYQQDRNRFLVMDGQQRLLSIYYFFVQRFPRREKRGELQGIFDQESCISESALEDDNYFQDFKLLLPEASPHKRNKLNGLNYETIGEHKSRLDLRPIRTIVVKKNEPKEDDSSVYEVFNRLNSGSVTLRPQEIRTRMYHSEFSKVLYAMNTNGMWRRLTNLDEPDSHMKDVEILLRGFAMLLDGKGYASPMVKFLNQFSKQCMSHGAKQNEYLKDLFASFLNACTHLPDNAFMNPRTNRFHVALYEAVFAAACGRAFAERSLVKDPLNFQWLQSLKADQEFIAASSVAATGKTNVEKRLHIAQKIAGS